MKRKIAAGLLTLTLSGSILLGIYAQDIIVNSMDFQGSGVELTLKSASEQLLKNNPNLEKIKLDIEASDIEYDSLTSQAKNNSREDPDRDIKGPPKEGSASYLQNVTLLTLKAAHTKDNAKRLYDDKIKELNKSLEEAYFGLLQAEQAQKVTEESVKLAKDLYEKTEKKLQLGFVTEKDLLSSKSSYIEAQTNLNKAEIAVKNAKMDLNILLGYDVMNELKLKETLSSKVFPAISIAEAISKALENSTGIKSAQFAYDTEEIMMEVIAKQYPDITYKYKEQKIKLQQAEKTLRDTKKNLEMGVRAKYLVIMQKQEEIKAIEEKITVTKKMLATTKSSFDLGMALVTDVQGLQTTLEKNQLDLSQAILQYNLAISDFENLVGDIK